MTIIAKDKEHLKLIIENEIKVNGEFCDLNHIDVSHVTDMGDLFDSSIFNGDISNWNTSNVELMYGMFSYSHFNGDISKWDTSKVTNMSSMFYDSRFNGNISNWNVNNVEKMVFMFCKSDFKGDLNSWCPFSLETIDYMFFDSNVNIPYWYNFDNKEERNIAINRYYESQKLDKKLVQELDIKNRTSKKNKI